MLSYINSINLIRYIIVWRVNRSLVWLPRYLSVEISAVLGSIIANRLPTRDASYWRKALAPWDEYFDEESGSRRESSNIPQASWPIETILFAYPGRRTYGRDELIVWELKLFGDSADHELFLELILPAMEEAGYTSDSRWNHSNNLWGKFDIHSIYVARGSNPEPLVADGILDLQYRANPVQWSEGLNFGAGLEQKFSKPTRLTWLTPFDLREFYSKKTRGKKKKTQDEIPNLKIILDAFESRIKPLIPGMEEQIVPQDVKEQADNTSIIHKKIANAKKWSGFSTGTQLFSCIPAEVIPYLELASILHIGNQIHFGCGTFALIRTTKG